MTKHFKMVAYLGVLFSLQTFGANLQNLGGIKSILTKKKLVVAMPKEDSIPFFMTDSIGKTQGLDAKIAEDIATKLGVSLIIDRTSTSFDDAVSKVARGKADLAICKLTTSLDRALDISFSTPYVQIKHVLLVNRLKESKYKLSFLKETISQIEDKDLNLGVKAGSYFSKVAKHNYPNAKITEFTTDQDLYDAVERAKVDAALTDDVNVNIWQNSHPTFALNVQKFYLEGRTGKIAIGVNWQNLQLQSWINLYLDTIKSEGTLEKWVHEFLETDTWKSQIAGK